MTTVHVVLPNDIDDPAAPSGGNTYDRRVCTGLTSLGWTVVEHAVSGTWPRPGAAAADGLRTVVASLPAGSVVLVDGLVASAAVAVLGTEGDRLRLVVLVHQPLGVALSSAADAEVVLRAEGRVLSAASAVVATSEWTRAWLTAAYALDPARVTVARPGVDPAAATAPSAHGSRLLCVAALTPAKGHLVLVEALAAVGDLPWECLVAGSLTRVPDHAAYVRDRIGVLGLDGRVRLTGALVGRPMQDAYAAADLLVLPSLHETFGMVVTEALARGLPVVATDVGGVRESLAAGPDGSRPGLLVPAGDSASLAHALRSWLTDDSLRRRLRASAARARQVLPGWEVTAAAVAAALTDAAGGQG